MLLVKTKIGPSKINGIGLFANQFIRRGTVTWRFDSRLDIYFNPSEVEKLPALQKEFIYHYAYLSKNSGRYVLSLDDTRFINHSSHPNVDVLQKVEDDAEGCGIAKRDIQVGEEITVDYRCLDADDESSKEEYLNKRLG